MASDDNRNSSDPWARRAPPHPPGTNPQGASPRVVIAVVGTILLLIGIMFGGMAWRTASARKLLAQAASYQASGNSVAARDALRSALAYRTSIPTTYLLDEEWSNAQSDADILDKRLNEATPPRATAAPSDPPAPSKPKVPFPNQFLVDGIRAQYPGRTEVLFSRNADDTSKLMYSACLPSILYQGNEDLKPVVFVDGSRLLLSGFVPLQYVTSNEGIHSTTIDTSTVASDLATISSILVRQSIPPGELQPRLQAVLDELYQKLSAARAKAVARSAKEPPYTTPPLTATKMQTSTTVVGDKTLVTTCRYGTSKEFGDAVMFETTVAVSE